MMSGVYHLDVVLATTLISSDICNLLFSHWISISIPGWETTGLPYLLVEVSLQWSFSVEDSSEDSCNTIHRLSTQRRKVFAARKQAGTIVWYPESFHIGWTRRNNTNLQLSIFRTKVQRAWARNFDKIQLTS